MNTSIETIINLFDQKGSQMYGGEAVTQLEHALQCATLACEAGKSNELITACLLHDVGHIIHDLGNHPTNEGLNDFHEHRALPVLRDLFEPAVTEPIRLHVAAKRYLCASNPDYWEKLSHESKRSLELQGGVFSQEAASKFINLPYGADAVELRIYDDRAKVSNKPSSSLSHFMQYVNPCLKTANS